MRPSTFGYAVALAFAALPHSLPSQGTRPIVAIFAHPDYERVIGPLLSRLAREGRETHLVIATDGSQGVRDFAKIPAGAALAAARTKEATCAANRLGVKKLHLLGLPDGGLASFDELGKLRSALVPIIASIKPGAIITFCPEGGTGHPDHRLVGDALKVLRPNGTLFASSNAARWEPEDFVRTIREAVAKANRNIVREHYVPQPPDFPISKAEPAYLKTLWLKIT